MLAVLLASLLGFTLFVAPVWLRSIPLEPARPLLFSLVSAAYNHMSTDTVLLFFGGGVALGCLLARWSAVILGWAFVLLPVFIIFVEGVAVWGTHSLVPFELAVYFCLGAVGGVGIAIGVSTRLILKENSAPT